MWKLIDDLYEGVPSDIHINDCVISDYIVCVNANNNIGVARLVDKPTHQGSEFVGKLLKDVACPSAWSDFTLAAVGMAAINSWYNSKEKISSLGELQQDFFDVTNSNNMAVVGESKIAGSGKRVDVFPLPMGAPINEDEYEELKDYDAVIISADAFVTGAMEHLVEFLGRDANIVIEGVSTPAAPSLITNDSSIKKIIGYYEETAENGNIEVNSVMSPFSLGIMK